MERLRIKSPDELQQQVKDVSLHLGVAVMPPSMNREPLPESLSAVDSAYPLRSHAYVAGLRALKTDQSAHLPPFTRDTIAGLNNADHYIQTLIPSGESPLFHRQTEALRHIGEHIEQGETEGYIKLPTGTGKTVLFAELTKALGLPTLVVVPRNILVRQTLEEYKKFAPGLSVGIINSNQKTYGGDVTITTYDSLPTIDPDRFRLMILDEAHRGLSPKRKDVIKSFEDTIKIGFTATPRFSENKQLKRLLHTEIYRMDIKEAVEEGLLSPFSVLFSHTDTDLTSVHVDQQGMYDPDELEKAINTAGRNTTAVELYCEKFHGQTSVAYCGGIAHATRLAEMFGEKDVTAEAIHGKMSHTQQQAILQRFKKGITKILCNADILIEGFNEPRASVCLNLRPTRSAVIAEQRGGRVLRTDSNNPNKHASIVEFIDQDQRDQMRPITFVDVVTGQPMTKTGISKTGINCPPLPQSNVEIGPVQVQKTVEEVFHLMPWKTVDGLANELGVSWPVIKHIVDKQLKAHPSWAQVRPHVKRGTPQRYLHPNLSAIVRNTVEHHKQITAPEGWISLITIQKYFGISHARLKKIVEMYKKDPAYKGFLRESRNIKGNTGTFLDPEFAYQLLTYKRGGQKPEDRDTIMKLSEKSKRMDQTEKKREQEKKRKERLKIYQKAYYQQQGEDIKERNREYQRKRRAEQKRLAEVRKALTEESKAH